MESGLLEKAPFITILVESKTATYPPLTDFLDMRERHLKEKLYFKHGECGAELEVTHVKMENPVYSFNTLKCLGCKAEVKMWPTGFWWELMWLATFKKRTVKDAFLFVRMSPPAPYDEENEDYNLNWWVGKSMRCDSENGCGPLPNFQYIV